MRPGAQHEGRWLRTPASTPAPHTIDRAPLDGADPSDERIEKRIPHE